MADRLRIATRKGLFTLRRRGSGFEPDGVAFLGEPVTAMLVDARDGRAYAALNLGHFGVKMHRSDDGGTTWREIATPTYPEQPESSAADPPWKLVQVWTLAAGAEPGTVWAGTLPGGLFRSDDAGATWTLNRPLWDLPGRADWFGGGYDVPGIHSISPDPRDPLRMLVAISCGGVWETTDGGASWASRCAGMRAAYMPPERVDDPSVQDPHAIARCAGSPDVLWCQHHNGIWHSADAGGRWRELRNLPVSSFGFAVAAHPHEPGTAWFVPAVADQQRVPVDGALVVQRVRDGGRSVDVLGDGLPQRGCFDLVYRHGLAVDAHGETLAMGSTTGNLWIADHGGERWSCVSHHLPPIAAVAFD